MPTIKLAIFDLDNTLWDGNAVYPAAINTIKYLDQEKIPMCVASFNINAATICNKLQISNYFKVIIGEHQRTKLEMINDIMQNLFPTLKQNEVIFLDDLKNNIEEVKNNSLVMVRQTPNGIQDEDFKYIKSLLLQYKSSTTPVPDIIKPANLLWILVLGLLFIIVSSLYLYARKSQSQRRIDTIGLVNHRQV